MYYSNKVRILQTDLTDNGRLAINTFEGQSTVPVPGAKIQISFTGQPDSVFQELTTDNIGRTEAAELKTPPLEYSMEPNQNMPYAEYTINVTATGFEPVTISGIQVLPGQIAVQNVYMRKVVTAPEFITIAIPDHTLYGTFPPKIAEAEIKPISRPGEIVLSKVVVPEFVIVHDGVPTDPTAANYYVRYRDYIKNVASSEIYATWSNSTIRANLSVIMSFTLNRVYTEWYRNKGYDFTITSSTAFDQKFVYGRNIFENISAIVDEIFDVYVARPNVKQPILTQYCDGNRTTCPQWLSQWGSKTLGDQKYSPIDIVRYYYGGDVYFNKAEEVSGVPSSFPGYNLQRGSRGEKVSQMQDQLNRISNNYPLIPKLAVDGDFGTKTEEAVKTFQTTFGLPPTGIVDFPTWYKISDIFVGVTRMAEL